MPDKLLSPEYGLSNSKLEECTANPSDVRSGKTFYSGDKNKKTGTFSLSGNAAASNVLSGKTFYSNSFTRQTGNMTNRGAWGTTINPGGSVTIPAGYHNGSGKVTANTVNPNMNLVNRTVSWGDGVIFSGDDTSASKACQFGLQYYAHSDYNVHIDFRIYRNNSHIDTIRIVREGGLLYDPRGYISKRYEGSGTYKYDVNVTYHAGNGSLMIGGMIVGY